MPRAKKTVGITDNVSERINYVKPVTDFPFVYANNAVLSFTQFDASLLMGEMVGEEDGKLVVIPKVKVQMALPFAKQLRNLLVMQVEQWEDAHGEIPVFQKKKPEK